MGVRALRMIAGEYECVLARACISVRSIPNSTRRPNAPTRGSIAARCAARSTTSASARIGRIAPGTRWTTRRVDELRQGSYFPESWGPGGTAEKARAALIQEAYLQGISTRPVDDLVKALGMSGVSKSKISRLCGELDEQVAPS